MNTRNGGMVKVVLACAAIGVATFAMGAGGRPDPAGSAQTACEYMITGGSLQKAGADQQLNELGAKGWEIASIQTSEHGYSVIVMKRRK